MTKVVQKLVSVIVASYNASTTIKDTLDSIYAQTYSNIELIITDDASSDDTVSVAQQWLDQHSQRFENCILNANPVNLGVPSNMNTGILTAHGYYVKILAADDILSPEYVAVHVSCCEENGYDNLSSCMRPFRMKDSQKIFYDNYFAFDASFFEKSPLEQYRALLLQNQVFAPTFIATKDFMTKHDLYDTRFRFMEDYPFFLKVTKQGAKLHFLDTCAVEYRLSDSSLSNTSQTRIVSPGFHRTARDFFFKERFFGLLRNRNFKRLLGETRRFFYTELIILLGNDRRNPVVGFLDNVKNRTLFKKPTH